MFDSIKFESMPPFRVSKYWFIRESEDSFRVIDLATREDNGCTVVESKAGPVVMPEDSTREIDNYVLSDFHSFTRRPEYQVGRLVNTAELSLEQAIDIYETLLAGITFIRAYESNHDPDNAFKKFNVTCLEWLRTTDMYTAPASTQYHESFHGGLLYHTLNVYNKAIELKGIKTFETIEIHSAALAALTHDWCKIGLYESYTKNVKNNETNKWEQVTAYRYNQTGIPLGHGVSSMFIASKCFKLSQAEALAIRWHMGWCRVADADMNELQLANETCPLVHLIQFADQLSICKY